MNTLENDLIALINYHVTEHPRSRLSADVLRTMLHVGLRYRDESALVIDSHADGTHGLTVRLADDSVYWMEASAEGWIDPRGMARLRGREASFDEVLAAIGYVLHEGVVTLPDRVPHGIVADGRIIAITSHSHAISPSDIIATAEALHADYGCTPNWLIRPDQPLRDWVKHLRDMQERDKLIDLSPYLDDYEARVEVGADAAYEIYKPIREPDGRLPLGRRYRSWTFSQPTGPLNSNTDRLVSGWPTEPTTAPLNSWYRRSAWNFG